MTAVINKVAVKSNPSTRRPRHLSFKTCAGRAYAAASEASDGLLAPLLGHDLDTATDTTLSQRERCQEAFQATRESLLEFGPAERQISHRSVFPAWKKMALGHTLLPSSQAQRFRGIGSSTRTDSASRGCDSLQALWSAKPAGTRRDMPQESPGTVARHEQAKRAIGTALATLEGVQVRLEPLVIGTQRRDDIRITGSASSGLSSEDIDITIISLASQDSQTAMLPLATTVDDSAAQRAAKLVDKHLNAVAREKRRRHPPSDRPFRPFILSLGGMTETDAKDALKVWKLIMTGGVYSLLVRQLSLGLMRARARSFEP
jgi:hypothetical protein